MSVKNGHIEEVQKLLSKLSQQELITLKKYLKSFHPYLQQDTKTTQVLELLLQKKDLKTIIKKLQEISESERTVNHLMLLHRLKKKIDEVLLLDVNVHRKDAYEENVSAQLDIAKELPLVQIYFGRGLVKETNRVLTSIIQK